MLSRGILAFVILVGTAPVICGETSSPIVDLGYTLHQATIEVPNALPTILVTTKHFL